MTSKQNPKKFLIFSLSYFPFAGGAEVAIREITDRISLGEIEFDMVTPHYDSTLPKVEKIGNVTVHRIGFGTKNPTTGNLKGLVHTFNKLWFQCAAVCKAHKLHKKNNYDGVWAMMAHSSGVPAALFKKFHKNIPYILTLQEGDPLEYIERKMRVFGPLFRGAFTKADSVQAISTFLGKWAGKMGFAGEPRIIPNGVDVAQFTKEYSSEELEDAKKRIHYKENHTYIITTSRLVTKNAVDDVIKSLTHLPDHFVFVVLGIGPDEEQLRVLAQERGVADRVIFVGHVEHDELPKYLKVCDIFTRPSLSEGMGNSFIEAMAAGLPVVATQEGGITDFLFDPDRNPDKKPTGLVVDPRSPKQLAEQFERLVGNTELRNELTANAHDLAVSNYDWNLIAERMRKEVFLTVFK